MLRVELRPSVTRCLHVEIRRTRTDPAFSRTVTPRVHEALVALTHKVRFLSLDQVARAWWNDTSTGRTEARRALRRIEEQGLLAHRTISAHPELLIAAPVYRWEPGDPTPDPNRAAYALRSRWTKPIQDTLVFVASKRAAERFGGVGGRIKLPLQATHDLHVATVYLHYRCTMPAAAEQWCSEEILARRSRPRPGEKLPDAVLCNALGEPFFVVEFGGSYGADRVAKLHRYCEERGLAYELW